MEPQSGEVSCWKPPSLPPPQAPLKAPVLASEGGLLLAQCLARALPSVSTEADGSALIGVFRAALLSHAKSFLGVFFPVFRPA